MNKIKFSIALAYSVALVSCGTVPLPVDLAARDATKAVELAEPEKPDAQVSDSAADGVALSGIGDANTTPETTIAPKNITPNEDNSTVAAIDEKEQTSGVFTATAEETSDRIRQPDDAVASTKTPKPETPIIEKEDLLAPPIISSNRSIERHVQRAIKNLREGREHIARLELTTALDKKSGYMDAEILMQQIEQPAEDIFTEKESFEYRMNSGDTLMSVSKKFLGSPLKFYALAKLNNISRPNDVAPGMILKVPGSGAKVQTSSGESNSVNAVKQASLDDIRDLISEGKYLSAIDFLSAIEQPSLTQQTLLEDVYITYTSELVSKTSLLEAQALLESALNTQPHSERLKQQLQFVKSKREAERLFTIGLSELGVGNRIEAFENFRKTLKLNPKHMLAKKQLGSIKNDVVEIYHKRALQHYMKHELADAVDVWNDILDIEPTHAMARVYIEKAKSLQKRLNKF